jgi:hypothetical protein
MASTFADGESTPLLSPNGKEEGSSFYFINQNKKNPSFKQPDGGLVQDALPPGANPDEFAPRVLGAKVRNNVAFPSLSSRLFESNLAHSVYILIID